MNDLIEFLAANPFFVVIGIVASILGVLSIPVSLYLYFKSKRERRPRYAFRNINIICGHKQRYPAVTVHFENYGDDILNLSVSKLVFWNQGKETIRKQDIVKPGIFLRIKEGFKILDVSVVKYTTRENKAEISRSQDRTSASITFDYFDHNEGVIFQVFHTGTSPEHLFVSGIIMGSGEPRRSTLVPLPKVRLLNPVFLSFSAGVLLMLLVVFRATIYHDPETGLPYLKHVAETAFFMTLGSLLGSFGVNCLVVLRAIPKGLEKDFFADS